MIAFFWNVTDYFSCCSTDFLWNSHRTLWLRKITVGELHLQPPTWFPEMSPETDSQSSCPTNSLCIYFFSPGEKAQWKSHHFSWLDTASFCCSWTSRTWKVDSPGDLPSVPTGESGLCQRGTCSCILNTHSMLTIPPRKDARSGSSI